MDKRSKKHEKTKLRKEDIGTPVNFVHVQHVGFGAQKSISQSACTSPTFENMDSFFNHENFRRSDTSMGGNGKINPGKENRFSNSPALPPYSSMSNLSIMGNSYEKVPTGTVGSSKFAGVGKQKSIKSSFSGSLLNLNFFPFTKSSSAQQDRLTRGSKSDHDSIRTKRLSLGVGFPISSGPAPISFQQARPVTGPPMTPPPPSTSSQQNNSSSGPRTHIRRRSSSFHGESDNVVDCTQVMGKPKHVPVSLTLNRHMLNNSNKKQKMGSQPPSITSSPPLSPDYYELPPPPDMSFSSNSTDLRPISGLPPESPSYIELPPPPMLEMVPRKMSTSRQLEFRLPPPPPPPTTQRKLSDIAFSPPPTPNDDLPPPPSPPSTPPPLPTSPPPMLNTNQRVGYKFAPLKAKLIRVNAPTLPPLRVPLVRPKSQSPGTPSTWPLEPGIPELYQPITQHDFSDSAEPLRSNDKVTQQITQGCNQIDSNHIERLSKIFQSSFTYKQWPIMMNRLFSNSNNVACEEILKDAEFTKVYNNLIQNTLELYIKLEGGNTNSETLQRAFAQAQSELSSQEDCGDNVTKM